MNKMITTLEELLCLMKRTLAVIQYIRVFSVAGLMLMGAVLPAHAYDTRENPDRYLSVELDVSSGHLPGILTAYGNLPANSPQTNGGFVKGALDVRVPVTNTLTFHAFGSDTGVNNNLQFSEGSEVGLGLRVYLH